MGLSQQPGQQRNKGHADQGNASSGDKLFYSQLGVKLCSMAGGGVVLIGLQLIPLLSGLFS